MAIQTKNSNFYRLQVGREKNYEIELYDLDSTLTRFRARDYDSMVGRWTTKVPIGFNGGDTNLYAYVGGNPMSHYDATVGRWTTKDPFGFAGGDTNLYANLGGNPMSYVDPTGNCPACVPVI